MSVIGNPIVTCRSIVDINSVGGTIVAHPTAGRARSPFVFKNRITASGDQSIHALDGTYARATTASFKDFEAAIRIALSGELRREGARRVENLNAASEDMTDGGYSAGAGAVVDSPTQATFDGTANGFVQAPTVTLVDDGSGATNRTFVASVKIKLVSGTISADSAMQLAVTGDAVTFVQVDIGDDISSTSARITVTAISDAAGTQIALKIFWDDAGVLELTEWQLEELHGATIATPSEYVSTGVESAPYHGYGVDGVNFFDYVNAITVTSNVVDESANPGAAFTNDIGYLAEGQRINLALRNRTWENASWTKSNVTAADNEVVGPDGHKLAASLTATAGNGTVIQDLGVIASADKAWGPWIKRKTGTGDIDLTLNGGGAWTTITVTAGWTRVEITAELADPDIGIRIVTSGDAIYVDWGQCEASTFLSSTIVPATEGAAVTRNSDVLTFDDEGNIFDAQGTAFAKASTEWSVSSTNARLLARNAEGMLQSNTGSNDDVIVSRDGTSTSIAPIGLDMLDAVRKMAATWGSVMTAYSCGNLAPDATPASYDGTMGAGDLAIGSRNDGAGPWDGTIALVMIFANQMSDYQVTLLGDYPI